MVTEHKMQISVENTVVYGSTKANNTFLIHPAGKSTTNAEMLDEKHRNAMLPIRKLVNTVKEIRWQVLTLFLTLKFVCGIFSAGI